MKRLALLFAFVVGATACVATLTPADETTVITTTVELAACQQIGRACQADGGKPADCYAQYDACIRDAGLRENQ